MFSRAILIVSSLSALAAASCARSSAKAPSPSSALATLPLAAARKPSFALLRDFAHGKPSATGLIDPKAGLVVVTVGPAYDRDGNSADLDEAKRLCGEKAVREGLASIRLLLSNSKDEGDLDTAYPCKSLRCDKPAIGEWGQDTAFTFRRTDDGRLVLESIVNVLDVPLRPDAEKDFPVAEKHRVDLAGTQCPTTARRP